MGCVDNITADKFPKQRDKNYKYPQYAVGARVSVCYHYDTSKQHLGTIVRDDIEEPFETIIKLDNGRYIRGVECQFRYLDNTGSSTGDPMERLTYRGKDNKAYCDYETRDIINKLAEYEDAEEQGLLLRLPCKVGDKVYTIHSVAPNRHIICEIDNVDKFFLMLSVAEERFGKTVFLTQEEAEQKLKEMESERYE